MKILDIDLDFFLSDIFRNPAEGVRPSARNYIPWAPKCVRKFMERNCGLACASRPPAIVVRAHDQAFDLWRKQIRSGQLHAPFDVIHIDAHADLGGFSGDMSYHYIQTELLHAEPSKRQEPKRGGWDGLDETNYLAFALACRWLQSLTYAHHPLAPTNNELPRYLFQNWDLDTRMIELGCYHPRDLPRRRLYELKVPPEPLSREPQVPISVVPGRQIKDDGKFAFGYVSISPRYTPKEAELLIPIIGQYMRFLDAGDFLQAGE